MAYDLMLLADPGPNRADVLKVLQSASDVRPDSQLPDRFWLRTPHGEAQINVGTKDPVESVHMEFDLDHLPLMEAATLRALELAEHLGMRVEDVQWGHEITSTALPTLRKHWVSLMERRTSLASTNASEARRPWWRLW